MAVGDLKKLQTKLFPAEYEVSSTNLVSCSKFPKNNWLYAKLIATKDLGDRLLLVFKTRQEIIMNLFIKK